MSETFRFAQKKGVPIFILTTNDIPKEGKQQLFVDIFDEIGVKINKESVFGGDAKGKKYPTKENVILNTISKSIKKQSDIQKGYYELNGGRRTKKNRKSRKVRKSRKSRKYRK